MEATDHGIAANIEHHGLKNLLGFTNKRHFDSAGFQSSC